MSRELENVVGHIPVVARLALGIEQLVLFLTDVRIIVAHVGKRGAGALATSALFGRLSGGVEDVLKSGTESRGRRSLQSIRPESILAANKDNFQLGFEEIVSVKLVEMPFNAEMTLLTRDDKFDFQTSVPVDQIVGLLQMPLGPRLIVERLPVNMRPGRKR